LKYNFKLRNQANLENMEFNFNCERLLSCDSEGFVVIDGKRGITGMSLSSAVATVNT